MQRGPGVAPSFHMGLRPGSEQPLFSHRPFWLALVWRPEVSLGLQRLSAPAKGGPGKRTPHTLLQVWRCCSKSALASQANLGSPPVPSLLSPGTALPQKQQTCAGGHDLELLHQRVQQLASLQFALAGFSPAAHGRCRVEEPHVGGEWLAQAAVQGFNLLLLLAL